MVIWIWLVATLIVLQRLAELVLSNRNYRWMLAQGAKEYGDGHYPLFFALHAGWLISWLGEAILSGPCLNKIWHLWAALFIVAQGLRYWCIISLGRYWNTRILVIPGAKLVTRGPYRFISHPNYLAVSMELASVPLIFDAWLTALAASVLNAWLLLGVRIPLEQKALQQLTK